MAEPVGTLPGISYQLNSSGRTVTPIMEKPMWGGTETVLLVEDEPAIRTLTHHALNRLGYKVIEAESGVRQLQRIMICWLRPGPCL